jgi:amino acid transporter
LEAPSRPALKRAVGLPLLVFYGLGVTIGAGIFALVGEILAIAGGLAPAAFLLAGLVAAVTARGYAILARLYPRAAGAGVYVYEGFGPTAGLAAGLGVAVTGIISSAVISLAFADYVATLVPVAKPALVIGLLVALAAIAAVGVRESLAFAAVITVLEVGTLLVVGLAGVPGLLGGGFASVALVPTDRVAFDLTVAAAAVAFFAFIGFEDIVNMAEEAKDPRRTMGPAVAITLLATLVIYMLIAAVAAAYPGRDAIAASDAPLADLFAGLTGLPGEPVVIIAAVSMINGVLVQIVMASRVLYGLASDGLLPRFLARVAPRRRTPLAATVVVTALIALLTLVAPLLGLARATGYVTLVVFIAVNLSLFRLGSRQAWPAGRRQRWWGVAGAGLAAALLLYEAQRALLAAP